MRSESCHSGPTSRTTTCLPAFASSPANAEPEAPAPTMATSTFSRMAMSPPLQGRDVRHVGNAERRVAIERAIHYVDGVAPQHEVHECAGRTLPAFDLVLAHQVDEVALLVACKPREPAPALRQTRALDGAQGSPVEIGKRRADVEDARLQQRFFRRNGDLRIDELGDARCARAGNQSLAQCLEGFDLVGLEQAERCALGAGAREEAARASGVRRYRAAAARIAGAFLHPRAAGLRNFLLAPLGLSRSSRSFRLLCHPGSASEAVRSIAARVHRTREGIAVTYSLEGQLARLRISPPRPPRIAARLWQHTCCEIFIARKGLPGYQEFNLAPSGEWAAYAFARYREGVPLVDEKLDPRISVRSSGEKLELDAFIRVDRAALSLALAAVVEDEHGALSYWALKHPPGKPDFHHPDAFAAELDAVRN